MKKILILMVTDNNDSMVNNSKTATSKSFKYKIKITGRTGNNNSSLNAEVVVPLKYSNNFCRSLDLLLINCEIELGLTWSQYFVISKGSRTFRGGNSNNWSNISNK